MDFFNTSGNNNQKTNGYEAGLYDFLCGRLFSAYEAFYVNSKNDACAAFNCALCLVKAGDNAKALEFIEQAERLMKASLDIPKKSAVMPDSILKFEKSSQAYLMPVCEQMKTQNADAFKTAVQRTKADVLFALGKTDELRKVIQALAGKGYSNIENIIKQLNL